MPNYLARAVSRAIGAHTTPLVVPDRPPVFLPAQIEAATAHLEPQGEIVFRPMAVPSRAEPLPPNHPFTAPAPLSTVLPRPAVQEIEPLQANLDDKLSVPAVAQPLPAQTMRDTVEIQSQDIHLSEPHPLRPVMRPAPITAQAAVQNAIAAVVRAIESHPEKDELPRNSSTEEPVLREILPRQDLRQKIEPREAQQQQSQPASQPAPSPALPRQPSLRQEARGGGEETSVQVHIGRVEVRVAAPPAAPAAPLAKPRGRRGFAEYEAIRRYTTRYRM